MVIILAEKPSVAREFAKALWGTEALTGSFQNIPVTCCAARGHLMELVLPEAYDDNLKQWSIETIPFHPQDWAFRYGMVANSRDVYRNLKDIFSRLVPGDEIINACDAGREGEHIFRTVTESLVSRTQRSRYTWSRIWVQTMTLEGLLQSFVSRRPLSERDGLARAGAARAACDWFLGMNGTRLATTGTESGCFMETVGGVAKRRPKRVGRVKTPTMALVVRRDFLIENFRPQAIFKVRALFPSLANSSKPYSEVVLKPYIDNDNVRSQVLGVSSQDPLDVREVFWTEAKASSFISALRGTANPSRFKVSTREGSKVSEPPLPYSLTDIQREASKSLGLTAKKTLEYLQTLYESKYISYPRTDFSHFPDDMKASIPEIVARSISAISNLRGGGPVSRVQGVLDVAQARLSKAFNSAKVGDHYALVPTGNFDGLGSISEPCQELFCMIVSRCLQALDRPATYRTWSREWVKDAPAVLPVGPAVFRRGFSQLTSVGWKRWLNASVDEEDAGSPTACGDHEVALDFQLHQGQTEPPKRFNEDTLLGAMESASKYVETSGDDTFTVADLSAAMRDSGLGTPATRADTIEELVGDQYFDRVKGKRSKASEFISTPRARQLFSELDQRMPWILSPAVTGEWECHLSRMARNDPAALSFEGFLSLVKTKLLEAKARFIQMGVPQSRTRATPLGSVVFNIGGETVPAQEFPDKWVLDIKKWPGIRLSKVICQKTITITDYEHVLTELLAKRPSPVIEGFISKAGRPFQASFKVDKSPTYGWGLSFDFPPRK